MTYTLEYQVKQLAYKQKYIEDQLTALATQQFLQSKKLYSQENQLDHLDHEVDSIEDTINRIKGVNKERKIPKIENALDEPKKKSNYI